MKLITHIRLSLFFILLSVLTAEAQLPVQHRKPLKAEFQHDYVTHPDILRAQSRRRAVSDGKARGLVLIVEFADRAFYDDNDQAAFDSLANASRYGYDNAYGSTRSYFYEQSCGQYNPYFDVVGPLVLPKTSADYAKRRRTDDVEPYIADFVMDACRIAHDEWGVDFSLYDSDGDDAVDFVYIIYAGYGAHERGGNTTIWPHEWELSAALANGLTSQDEYYVDYDFDQDIILSYNMPVYDGKMIDLYACSNELDRYDRRTGIGTMCHEFSHVLGFPDYYVTSDDFTVNADEEPGSWALMSYGNYANYGKTPINYSVYDKFYAGWITPQLLSQPTQHLVLPPDGKTYYMITRDGQMPSQGAYTPDTIYYLENRQLTGWDTYLPGHGLLVWRVIYDHEQWYNNTPNDYSMRINLISASGNNPYTTLNTQGGTRQDVPFPGEYQVTEFRTWPDFYLTNIVEHPDGTITFDFGDTTTIRPQLDINRDGLIDTQDILCIYQFMQNPSTDQPDHITPDVNSNGVVDTQDVLTLYEYMQKQ